MGLRQMSPGDDSAIMAYLVDSTSGKYDLDACTARILERESPQGGETLFDVELADETLLARASDVGELLEVLNVQMTSLALDDLYRNIELPLVRVLGRMEARGICVDRNLLRVTAEEFADEAKQLDTRIQELAGHSFKVNSPAQMQVVLFEELRLTPGKKTKTGFSTDASTLESIVHEHEIVPLILRFREVDKLRSTYGESLIGAVADDGRIHATFNQMVARTGRLSSENPNLHNIPVRSADGKRLRHAFGPQAGWQLAVSDYNQIELRILAHLSGDEGLLRAFASGSDVHRAIAAIVYSIAPEDVTSQQREFAKAVSYGLAYGMEAYGLSQRLQISVGEAKSIMQQYFGGFPSLHDYMERTVSEIRARGYSRTEMGRIRPFPDLQTASGPQRAAAERQAMNAGIQGLAADIFKSALVRLDAALEASSLEARLVLQVHDEVLVEAPASEREAVEALMREALTGAASLRVPLDVSLHWGSNWAVAKG
jgi:DNA polymerase-1